MKKRTDLIDKSITDSKVRLIDWLFNKMYYNREYQTGAKTKPVLKYLFEKREDLTTEPEPGNKFYFVITGDFDLIKKVRIRRTKNQLKLW